MDIYQGKSICSGVVFGKVHLLAQQESAVERAPAFDMDAEWNRYLDAKRQADAQLERLYEQTVAGIGSKQAEIIGIQRLMLVDGDFNEEIGAKIRRERCGAPYAVFKTGKQFADFFTALEDPYMNARATDILDVSRRLLDILMGWHDSLQLTEPVIILADDLTPSETLQLDKSKVLAFVIRRGSANSHTAILARALNIPCIVQTDIPRNPALSGQRMAVDGERGFCYIDPDEITIAELMDKQRAERASRTLLDSVRGLPTVTQSGRAVRLYANIGSPEELESVLENDAEGIGLYRSECLYLGREDYPGEEELFRAYRTVAEGMGGKPVIIRTLDIGADKKVDYFKLDDEENPALGLRGIRLCLTRPELFKTQLRAIYRTSAFGNVAVMFPMIASLWEVRRCKELAAEVRSELTGQGVYIGEVELGIMIETPAAVMVADSLAKEVDFFSVGTNDLTQYTLAVDRQNSKLDSFCDPRHPAVLAMLQRVARAAADHGIWAGICGELAADPELTEAFVAMGYSELSVAAPHVLDIRKHIREMA